MNKDIESDSDDGFECVGCHDVFEMEKVKHCVICNSEICDDCKKEGNIITFIDWLYDCPNKCDDCDMIGCSNCLNTCFICANEGDVSIKCKNCYTYKLIPCKYHSWYSCNLHTEEKCQECQANKNYDRYGM